MTAATGRWKPVTQASRAADVRRRLARLDLQYYNRTCQSRHACLCGKKKKKKHTETHRHTPEVCVHTDCNGTLTVMEENAKSRPNRDSLAVSCLGLRAEPEKRSSWPSSSSLSPPVKHAGLCYLRLASPFPSPHPPPPRRPTGEGEN